MLILKGVSVSISHLFSTPTRKFTSVDSKGLNVHERRKSTSARKAKLRTGGRTFPNNMLAQWLSMSRITSGLFEVLEGIGLRRKIRRTEGCSGERIRCYSADLGRRAAFLKRSRRVFSS